MLHNIQDNPLKSRFEMPVDGHEAYADYKREGEVLTIRYVYAAEALRGTGAAGRLMEGIADLARTENLKIVPLCGYAAAWLRKHKEYSAFVA